jgi:hypothetical protein
MDRIEKQQRDLADASKDVMELFNTGKTQKHQSPTRKKQLISPTS